LTRVAEHFGFLDLDDQLAIESVTRWLKFSTRLRLP